jgi:glycosyltransferase involved in cell wall biosynthesis
MRHDAKIDIVLATYNGERFIQRQIESVLAQMDDGCRLLVRDDGSSDRTLELVRQLARRCPDRIVFLDNGAERLGACGSFGRLLESSNADYVALCDQDDVWLPGRLSLPLERIRAVEQTFGATTPVLAHTDLAVVDEDLQAMAPSFWAYSRLDPLRGGRLNRLLVQNVVTGCATMMNRALVRRACPIPTAAPMHDWWLALVASAFGRIEAIPEKTILYRQHSTNSLGATRYNWRYVVRCAVDVMRGRAMARWRSTTQQQAAEFLQRFAATLEPRHRLTVSAYVGLEKANFIDRRVQILRHGFLKTGPLRNLGWLMMI